MTKRIRDLTAKQIELLPLIQGEYHKSKSQKHRAMALVIGDYLSGDKSQKTKQMVKIAVQLYQAQAQKNKITRIKKSLSYRAQKEEKKELLREKIILGACEHWAIKKHKPWAFISVLMAWREGYLSDRDRAFLGDRYHMEQWTGEKYKSWLIGCNHNDYLLEEIFDDNQKYHLKLTWGGTSWTFENNEIPNIDKEPSFLLLDEASETNFELGDDWFDF